jgi:hypothetical protein
LHLGQGLIEKRIFLVSAVTASFVSLNIASAAQNCMLLKEAEGMRECFDQTFSTTPKPEAATSASERSSSRPKLSPPPKTQSVSDGSPK